MDFKRLFAKGLRIILQPAAITESKVDKNARICSGTHVNYSKIERYSYIGHNGFLSNVEVGPFCSIADNCFIGGAEHALNRVSTSPVFHKGKNVLGCNFGLYEEPKQKKTIIGPDVWIAANVIIKAGVCIGTGAVIGAGSVVTHDVPAYEIWAGNPAKKIRNRFDESVAKKLLSSQWWTWSEAELRERIDFFEAPVDL